MLAWVSGVLIGLHCWTTVSIAEGPGVACLGSGVDTLVAFVAGIEYSMEVWGRGHGVLKCVDSEPEVD